MICEMCETEFIVLGGLRKCRCSCGDKHMICRTCREALVANGQGKYDEEPGIGFLMDLCPAAIRVAKEMMKGGSENAVGFKKKRLTKEQKIEAVKSVVLEHFLERERSLTLTALANKLEWHPSRVRSVIREAEVQKAIRSQTNYSSRRHLYRPRTSFLIRHIQDLREEVLALQKEVGTL